MTKDFKAEFGREGSEEIDLDELANVGRDIRELREAALCEDALQHEIAMFTGCGRE